MKVICIFVFLISVSGTLANAQTFPNKLSGHNIHTVIPSGWKTPAAAIGSVAPPRIQDGRRTVSAIAHEVYLSPNHAKDWGEIELALFEVDASSWLNAICFQPENWLPVQRDKLLTYTDKTSSNTACSLVPFGDATAVKLKVSRTLSGLNNQSIRFTESVFYCSCRGMLVRIQFRSNPSYFKELQASSFKTFEENLICSRN